MTESVPNLTVPNLSSKHQKVCDKGLESGCGTLDNIEETVTQSSDVIEGICDVIKGHVTNNRVELDQILHLVFVPAT